MEILGATQRKGGVIITPNKLVFTFGGSYICANFGENRSRNVTLRKLADEYTDRQTNANWFYNLSHAINQSINQSWIYIAHTRKASNALVR